MSSLSCGVAFYEFSRTKKVVLGQKFVEHVLYDGSTHKIGQLNSGFVVIADCQVDVGNPNHALDIRPVFKTEPLE